MKFTYFVKVSISLQLYTQLRSYKVKIKIKIKGHYKIKNITNLQVQHRFSLDLVSFTWLLYTCSNLGINEYLYALISVTSTTSTWVIVEAITTYECHITADRELEWANPSECPISWTATSCRFVIVEPEWNPLTHEYLSCLVF